MTNDSFTHEGGTMACIQEPMPALALAYDYEYDEPGNDSQESSMGSHNYLQSPEFSSLSLHSRPFSSNLGSNFGGGFGTGGGGTKGGSGGKHKCPKCGNSVTFKHTDFEENTFYCASCSGWFLVKNSGRNTEVSQPVQHGHGSAGGYLEFKDATAYSGEQNGGTTRRLSQSQIVMQHVSSMMKPSLKKIFSSQLNHVTLFVRFRKKQMAVEHPVVVRVNHQNKHCQMEETKMTKKPIVLMVKDLTKLRPHPKDYPHLLKFARV
jgi:hypothetical protein